MALARKTTILLGSFLFAASTMAACAGDGAESTTGGSGNTTGSGNTSGSGNKAGSSSTPTGTGNTTGSGNTSGTPPGNSSGGITTVGGYHSSGTLKGYFWTSADSKAPGTGTSTVMPETFESTPKICASGVAAKVPSDTAYSTHWGTLVGWNVNQGEMPPNDPSTAAITGTITVGVSGSKVPSGLRIKVAVGSTDYCAPLVSGSNTIKASDLKKECWLTAGAAYAGEPVAAIAVQVTTNTMSTTPFDFCITEMSIK